jgi:hypothetical protein
MDVLFAVGFPNFKNMSLGSVITKCNRKSAGLPYPIHPLFICYIHMGNNRLYFPLFCQVTDFPENTKLPPSGPQTAKLPISLHSPGPGPVDPLENNYPQIYRKTPRTTIP